MSTIPVVSLTSDSWPTIFSHPRNFNRELENKPYLTYLDEIYQRDYESDSGTENSDDESSADGDIGEDEEGNSSPEDESDAVSTAYADDLVVGTFTPIRRFSMKTISEETEYSVPLGGDDPVADFVEHAMETRFKDSNVGALSKSLVALLDVESKTSLDTAARPRRRRAKPFRGGLTRARLQTELEKPRFPTQGSDKLRLTNEVQIYLDRRSIYIPDLDALEMDKLANTATLGQRGGLLNFFHHHVSPSPFIGVIIPSNGFRQFNLHMHLPYFALREQVSLFRDPRKQPNGAPLRGSWVLSCLDTSGRSRVPEDGPKSCLYDAQISMFIVGIEERVWTTIGTADTFFERKGSLNSIKYHHDRRKTGSVAHWQDPISGRVWPSVALNEIDPSFSDPRKYFLSVLDHRVRTVLVEEYGKITGRMEEVVKDWCSTDSSWQMRDFAKWNEDIQELLTMIVDRVSDTLDAWRFFDRADLEYFTDKSHQPYFRGIKRSMRKLEGYHETLQKLKERAKAKSEAISARIGLENHDATVNVHKLAVLAMVFAPLSTVVSLFGAEGLPFGTLNIRTFGLMLMGLVLVYGIVYWLIRNWKATVKPYARACGKRLSPFFDVVSVLSRIQGALQAGARVLAGGNDRIEMVSEFSVSEPPVAELPSPVQSRTRTGTWSSWSKSLRRRPTEEPQVELGDV